MIDTSKATAYASGQGEGSRPHGVMMLPANRCPTCPADDRRVPAASHEHGGDPPRRGRSKVYFLEDKVIPNTAILDRCSPPLAAWADRVDGDGCAHASGRSGGEQVGNPISEGLALQAIRIIVEYLPKVLERPTDLEARVQMQLASTMAGWAFSVAGVGLVHGMSHSLGARVGVPHGTANGIILPHVMRFNAQVAAGKLALVARALGVTGDLDDAQLAAAAANEVAGLLARTGHPTRLSEVGVKPSDLEACAALALTDGATMTNPRGALPRKRCSQSTATQAEPLDVARRAEARRMAPRFPGPRVQRRGRLAAVRGGAMTHVLPGPGTSRAISALRGSRYHCSRAQRPPCVGCGLGGAVPAPTCQRVPRAPCTSVA